MSASSILNELSCLSANLRPQQPLYGRLAGWLPGGVAAPHLKPNPVRACWKMEREENARFALERARKPLPPPPPPPRLSSPSPQSTSLTRFRSFAYKAVPGLLKK